MNARQCAASTVVATMLFGLAACVGAHQSAATHSTASTGQTDPDAAKILQAAKAAAKANQDADPTSIEWVRTTYDNVEKVMAFGGQPGAETKQSVLVVVRGHFVTQTKGPPTTGDTLELALDPTTWQATDLGVDNSDPDLSPYGTVQHG